MRLKFIEYIINAACCECRCERARSGSLVYRDLHEIFSNPKLKDKKINNDRLLSYRIIDNLFSENLFNFAKQCYYSRTKPQEREALRARDVKFSMETN